MTSQVLPYFSCSRKPPTTQSYSCYCVHQFDIN